MKKTKGLIILPLVALLLSGCNTLIIPEDAPKEESSEKTPEETQPDEDEDLENPDDSNDPNDPNEPGGGSIQTYSLEITNKEELATITSGEDNPNLNSYTLDIYLYTYVDGELTNSIKANPTEVSVTSSNDNAIYVDGLTLVLGKESDSNITLTATYIEYSVSDSVNISYTYTPHQEVTTYRYELNITNANALAATWKIDDGGTRTVAVSVARYTLIDGVEQANPDIDTSGTDVSLTQEGEGEVLITGLDIAPSKVGSLVLTATYTNGEYTASDSVELVIEDSIYEYNYDLTIDNKDTVETSEQDPWVYQTGSKTVYISLSYSTYTASTGESAESTITGTTQNVSISVYNASGEAADNDITYYANTEGGISLSLNAVNSAYYTVLFTWIGHDASDSLTFYVSEPEEGTTTYSLSITNKEALTESWYLGDNDRTLEYSVKATTSGETTDVNLTDYINGLSVSTYPEGYVDANLDTSSGVITLTLVAIPEDQTTVSVYLRWETYGLTDSVSLNLSVHTYKIEITNSASLMADWTIEDEATRSVEYACYIDDTLQNPLALGHVSVSSSDDTIVSVDEDGKTLRANGAGAPTVSATWYSSEDEVEANILATDSVLLSINNTIKPATLSINEPSSTTLGLNESITLTATVLGKDGSPATDPEVTWESSNSTGISVAVDSQDCTKATVTGLIYSATATITATCGELTASIDLAVETEPVVEATPATLVNISYPASKVTSPDDRGVYVLGSESGDTYLKYDSSFATTSSYDEAAAVRVISVDGGYNLEINDTKVDSSLTLSGDAATFTLSGGALQLSGNNVYITESGLSTSGSDVAYLLDLDLEKEESTTTGGTDFIISATYNGITYYAADYDSASNHKRFNSTTNINEATKFNLENVSGNSYYMTFNNNGTTTYIYLDSSNNYVDTSTSPTAIYYDATNGAWADIDDTSSDKFFLYNGSAGYFSSYAHSNLTNSGYSTATLTISEDVPSLKGIALSSDAYSVLAGNTATISVTTYPALAGEYAVSDLTFEYNSSYISIEEGIIHSTSAGTTTVKGTINSVSDSFEFTVEENTTGQVSLTYECELNTSNKYFGSSSSGSGDSQETAAGTSENVNGLTWSYSSAHYKSYSNNDGLQIGSSSRPQTDSAFTLTANFEAEVTLQSVSLKLRNGSSGGGNWAVYMDSTTATSETFSSTSLIDVEASDLTVSGQYITIYMLSTKSAAMYLKSFTFTVLVSQGYNFPGLS